MNKTFKYFTLMLLAVLGFAMTSCGNDDETKPASQLVGTWKSVDESNADNDVQTVQYIRMNADGTGTTYMVTMAAGTTVNKTELRFTWTDVNNYLTIMLQGGIKAMEGSYVLSGNNFTLTPASAGGNTAAKMKFVRISEVDFNNYTK